MSIKSLLSAGLLAASFIGNAQDRNVTYAITGDGNNDFLWMNIRQVDLTSGQVTKTIFDRTSGNYRVSDVTNPKSTNVLQINPNFAGREFPTASLVASAAFDSRSNRLFFTPMRMAELRWLDLNSVEGRPEFFTIQAEALNIGNMHDEANHITRMTVASDGYLYAMTNDGNHLFKISTGRSPVVVDLGNVVDAESNNGMSIHSKCTSWGGDMIADAFGKLYVISASHQVYTIDPETRIATHMGTIGGLPVGYTTNSAAVSAENKFVVASANMFAGYYEVSMDGLNATKLEGSDLKYNASDFANSALLFEKKAAVVNSFEIKESPSVNTDASSTRIYPNPVTNGEFNINLSALTNGNYSVTISDLAGRAIQTNKVALLSGKQTVKMKINSRLTKGMFLVTVRDQDNTSLITEKILVQ